MPGNYPEVSIQHSEHGESLKSRIYTHFFQLLPNNVQVIKSRRMRWAEHTAHMGERKGIYRVLVGKPEGKRPLGRPRHRWEGAPVNAVMNLRVP